MSMTNSLSSLMSRWTKLPTRYFTTSAHIVSSKSVGKITAPVLASLDFPLAQRSVPRLHMSKQRRITVDLQSGGPQTWHAIRCNSPFPGTKFFLREFIAAARFLKIDRSATHCSNNRGLAACDPALGRAGRQLDSSSASAQQYFAGSQTIHVSLPCMPGRVG